MSISSQSGVRNSHPGACKPVKIECLSPKLLREQVAWSAAQAFKCAYFPRRVPSHYALCYKCEFVVEYCEARLRFVELGGVLWFFHTGGVILPVAAGPGCAVA